MSPANLQNSSWGKVDSYLSQSRASYHDNAQTLVLHDIQESDSGTYKYIYTIIEVYIFSF